MHKEILPIGSVLKTNEDGFLVPIASKDKIKTPWKETVNLVVEAYLQNIKKEDIHSIWLRGSIAKGEGIEYISDIDTFCLVRFPRENIDSSWFKEAAKKIEDVSPFLSKVEFTFVPQGEWISTSRFPNVNFTIKTQSVFLYGEDISAQIEPFIPDIELAISIQEDLPKRIHQLKERFEKKSNNEKIIRGNCSWIMKRIIRQGLVLVMDKEKAFSRDLYPCYQLFSKYYPEKEQQMKTALELVINPTDNKLDLYAFLDDFGGRIINESAKVLIIK